MSAPSVEGGPPPRRRRWRAAVVAIVVLLVAVTGYLVVQMVTQPTASGGIGDTERGGHAALARLIRDEGVTVSETERFSRLAAGTDEDTSVVVDATSRLSRQAWRGLLAERPGRIVLLAPTAQTLRNLRLPIEPLEQAQPGIAAPDCDDPSAQRSGVITVPASTLSYRADGAVLACYSVGSGGHLYVMTSVDGVDVVVMPRIGSNGLLAQEGNAALAMQSMGSHPSVIWYVPDPNDPTIPGSDSGGGNGNMLPYPSLLPPGWIHAVGLSFVALVVVAVWRGRRLGPIIVEELPSVVPAAETVEGHGRLYARIGARDTAATHLRTAARVRLSRLTGHTDDPEVLARALADRTGWEYGEIRHLLSGPSPATDDHLVVLKRKLDALEQEARRP